MPTPEVGMRRSWFRRIAAVEALTFSIGLLLVLLASDAKLGSITYTALLSLGIAFLTATAVMALGWIFGAEALMLIEDRLGVQRALRESGLREVHKQSGSEDFFRDLSSTMSIDVMRATGLTFVVQHLKDFETALASHRCRIRVLLTHPENVYLKSRELKEGLCPQTDLATEVPAVLQRLVYLINNTELFPGSSVEVRGYRCVPTGSVVILNGKTARYTPYLPYEHSGNVPVFDFDRSHGSDLVDKYLDTFERVWSQSDLLLGGGAGIGQSTRRGAWQPTAG
jgi:hypothetical protein